MNIEGPEPESREDPLEARKRELAENTKRTHEALSDLRNEIQTGVSGPRKIEKIDQEISKYNLMLERVKSGETEKEIKNDIELINAFLESRDTDVSGKSDTEKSQNDDKTRKFIEAKSKNEGLLKLIQSGEIEPLILKKIEELQNRRDGKKKSSDQTR